MVDWHALDYSMAPPGYRELRTSQVRVELQGMTYFILWGKDHLEWLQGQVTNDVRLLEERPWLDFCLTKPTGQLLALCRAWKDNDRLIVATAQPEVLRTRVMDSVILEDVVLSELDDPMVCIQGPGSERLTGALLSDRTGSGGHELPRSSSPVLESVSKEAFELATLEAAIPLFGIDTTDKTLPPELGSHFSSAHISYTKGCYTGQEVLMRIKARGHTNKTWVGLLSTEPIEARATVMFGGTTVGFVHRAAFSPAFGHIASATVRNEATKDRRVVRIGDIYATVVDLPFLR